MYYDRQSSQIQLYHYSKGRGNGEVDTMAAMYLEGVTCIAKAKPLRYSSPFLVRGGNYDDSGNEGVVLLFL